MSISYNKFLPIWLKGTDTITQGQVGYINKTSLQNNGRSEFRGDIFINNNSCLLINKDRSTNNSYYKLDVNSPSFFNFASY